MKDKECATEIRDHALNAITELSKALIASQGNCSEEEYSQIKKGVGLSIGKIQDGILDIICKKYPELDDIR